ncbi:MAG: PilN domain-containing protein [Vicinamibacteria bacterium]
MATSTNLALRPFRNERLPWFLAGSMLVAAIVISIFHGRFISRLLSGNEAATVREVRQNEDRISELERQVATEPPLKLEAAEINRLRTLKELVDRRVFPWRRLLSNLEESLSEDVRLRSISPAAPKAGRGVLILLDGEARSKDAAFSFAEGLDASPAFSNALIKSLDDSEGGTKFNIEVIFDAAAEAASIEAAAAGNPARTPGAKR